MSLKWKCESIDKKRRFCFLIAFHLLPYRIENWLNLYHPQGFTI